MADRRYRCFLSYSHRDRATAIWLHRALETYFLPRHLVGKVTAAGTVPRRLAPVFKDREELPVACNLASAIELALRNSDALIVLCSPDSANSPWVDREVERFKQLHGDERVFALLLRGAPADSFPPSLSVRFRDGSPTGELSEPLAADLRPEGDGRRQALLKLVAGLTGLDLDDLVRRDQNRRHRRLAFVASAAIVGMAGTSSLAIYALDQRDEALAQRAEADGLIEFMLTDLRGKLEPVGRLDVLKSVGDRALDYYARQKLQSLDGDSLGRRARAMLLVAEVGDLQGNSDAARRGFFEAARSTAELLEREPDDWQRVYDHAQSEFWLAYDAHNRGDSRGALPHFIAYRDLGKRMMELAPDKPESRLELASAEVNLGVALVAEHRLAEAVPSFDRAAAAFEAIRPFTRNTALNLNQALGHKASALYALGDNDGALATRAQQLEILSRSPLSADDREVQDVRAVALAQSGIALLASGDTDAGAHALRQARDQWAALVAVDPANHLWLGEAHAVQMWAAVARSATDRASARAALGSTIRDQRALVARSPDWVHKVNLLRMIGLDRALGGTDSGTDPIVREAWRRRASLKADDQAVLAAVLIDEGDRLAPADRDRARLLWHEASKLLSAQPAPTWTLIQRERVARRLGTSTGSSSTIARTAFAGVFAESPGL